MESGLIIFVIVVAGDVAALLYDVWRMYVAKIMSISRYCWHHPLWAIPLVAWNLAGALGLAYHLWVPPAGYVP
jgi:hypothetical protein